MPHSGLPMGEAQANPQVASASIMQLTAPSAVRPLLPHHSIHNALASGSGAVPSMGIEIAASRTHRDNLRRRILTFSENTIKSRLVDATEKIGSKTFCAPCWFHDANPDHAGYDCQHIAFGWSWDGSDFRSWKSNYDLPERHCFNCGLPQKHGVHRTVTRANPCPHADFGRMPCGSQIVGNLYSVQSCYLRPLQIEGLMLNGSQDLVLTIGS